MIERGSASLAADRFPGLYVGRVEERRAGGRIAVSVPAVFEGAEPAARATARPCFGQGHFFVPEVGEQVWIAFENGDPSAPVWLGVFYPEGEVPAEADTGQDPPVKRVIRSASGHVVILDDTAGSESVVIRDKSGSSLELRHDRVLIKCAQNLTIDARGKDVEIRANQVNVVRAR